MKHFFVSRLSSIVVLALILLGNPSRAQEDLSFFQQLETNYPGLERTKRAIQDHEQKSAEKAFLDYFRGRENLYVKATAKDVENIKQKFPKEVQRTLETAEQVSDRLFIFRYPWDMEKTNIPYQFEGEINWQANPFGDPEWTFMLNRHRYWQALGKAYLLTGKEKYAKTFVKQVTHWIDKNPISEKTKRTSWRRIEAGIRPENWIKSFEYFKNSSVITTAFLKKFLNALAEHAEYLNENFSKFSQTSNWGVLEFQGLYHIALFMPEFKKAHLWKKDAIQNLAVTAQNQVRDDGAQWEQSPMYHNEVFHSFLNVMLLAQRKAVELPKQFTEKTKAMAYANLQWRKPNYHQPLLGDSDDTDLRDILTTAGFVFMDPVIKSGAFTEADYENEFLFDPQSKEAYKNLKKQLPDFRSVFQPDVGDLYSRSSWKQDAFYSRFHLEKLGGGHAHDDLLHFSLFAFGRDYLVDPGRFTYVNNKWRKYFKGSRSHNTLAVDEKPNSIYSTSWGNSFDAKSEGVFSTTTKDFDYAEAINTAYQRLDDPVTVQRRMLYLKPDVWLLVDSFKAKGEHTYSQFFNFSNQKIKIDNHALLTTYPSKNLKITPINPGEMKLENAWMSPEYNLKEKTTKAEISIKKKGFAAFLTLLYFPKNTAVQYKKVPVYNRNDQLLSSKEVEAVKLILNDKEYILVVAHQSVPKRTAFFYIEGQAVLGEVVLIEVKNGDKKVTVIKP